MPTKFCDSGWSYLRDILLNVMKIHPNKGFQACKGLKLWVLIFYHFSHPLNVCKVCAEISRSLRGVAHSVF